MRKKWEEVERNPYFSHSLAVLFPLCAFLVTPATQAIAQKLVHTEVERGMVELKLHAHEQQNVAKLKLSFRTQLTIRICLPSSLLFAKPLQLCQSYG